MLTGRRHRPRRREGARSRCREKRQGLLPVAWEMALEQAEPLEPRPVEMPLALATALGTTLLLAMALAFETALALATGSEQVSGDESDPSRREALRARGIPGVRRMLSTQGMLIAQGPLAAAGLQAEA